MEDDESILAEKFNRAVDSLGARLERITLEQVYLRQILEHRLGGLEKQLEDHETRLRQLSESTTQFKTWMGASTGGATLMSIVALIKSFLGLP
jgi:hypothetical protein